MAHAHEHEGRSAEQPAVPLNLDDARSWLKYDKAARTMRNARAVDYCIAVLSSTPTQTMLRPLQKEWRVARATADNEERSQADIVKELRLKVLAKGQTF